MADSEFHDENQPALIAEAFDLITKDEQCLLSRSTWAFLWLSDIRCLQAIVRDLKSDNVGRAEYLKGLLFYPTKLENTIIKPWKARGPSESDDSDQVFESEATYRDTGCIITNVVAPPTFEVAHICPFPLSVELSDEKTKFWEYLGIFWPKDTVGAWKSAVDAWVPAMCSLSGAGGLLNVTTLGKHVHSAWNEFYFALKHIESDEKEQTLEFHWLKKQNRSEPSLMRKENVIKPPDLVCETDGPENCIFYDVIRKKEVRSGDKYRLRTAFPLELPLPSRALIELQWHLHRVTVLSGAAGDYMYRNYESDDYMYEDIISSPSYQTDGQGDGDSDTIA